MEEINKSFCKINILIYLFIKKKNPYPQQPLKEIFHNFAKFLKKKNQNKKPTNHTVF